VTRLPSKVTIVLREVVIVMLTVGLAVLAAKIGEAAHSILIAFFVSVALLGLVVIISWRGSATAADPDLMDSKPTYTVRDYRNQAIMMFVFGILWLGIAANYSIRSDPFGGFFKAAVAGGFLVGAFRALFEMKLLRNRTDS
jgi:hypothetical protein